MAAVPDATVVPSLHHRGMVVLGTGDGIGGEVANVLARAGADILCVDISREQAERHAARTGGHALQADITDRADMEKVFDRADALFGSSFHGVVDVVGVPVPGAFAEANDRDFDRQFDLVLRHAWLTISIAGPMLARQGRGSLIFVGSTGGFEYFPGVGLYCTAKAALHALAANAAVEFAPSGVRINTVAPGRVRDSGLMRPPEEMWERIGEHIPLRRVGRPADIAAAVLFLASDMSSYITGETLVVDGGMRGMTAMPNPKPQ